ncbi:hypothetical protein ACELLULO517_07840 [Acidisoma cellulosilytica]|uniref:Uncharacterized protein n=1 Tax=Acidisoma cellulosilyticum TaxID=2802395 RepID=A0A964E3N9_9PROT|nr:hypothetical protein [Acidisoma cellulosilyticum]MCB8880143.1 hypothetical protein [Acidisoma cellulosilyticum]
MNTDLLWAAVLMIGTGLLGLAVKEITAWQSTKDATDHPALLRLSALFVDVANSALAMLKANPTMTPHDAVAWMKAETKASAPGLITELGDDATEEGMTMLARRKLVSAAQATNLTDVADKVISTLAPSAATARIAPAQIVAVAAAVTTAVPL